MSVYVIRCTGTGLYKIGFAIDVAKRISSLQTGSASALELVLTMKGDVERERQLHARFAANRVRGEWFDLGQAEIEELKALIPPPDANARVRGELKPPNRPGEPWTVKIECPLCGSVHVHGAGMDGSAAPGHRVAHCASGSPGGYTIEADTRNLRLAAMLSDEDIADFIAEVSAVSDPGGPVFCANAVWYGRSGIPGLKSQLRSLVGWRGTTTFRDHADYDVLYEYAYDRLPNCRGCACPQL
jgi:hypothetical protein